MAGRPAPTAVLCSVERERGGREDPGWTLGTILRCRPGGYPVCLAPAVVCRGCGGHCCPAHTTVEPATGGPITDG